MQKQLHRAGFFLAVSALTGTAMADSGSIANVTVTGGPHAGKYQYASDDACMIAALPARPVGFSIVLSGEKSSLAIDVPNAAGNHVNELQIELVVADVKPGQSRKDTRSVTYTVDTRPDSALEAYQREERGGKGTSGKSTATLTQQGQSARFQFSGQTGQGVKVSGVVECHKVDREYGR